MERGAGKTERTVGRSHFSVNYYPFSRLTLSLSVLLSMVIIIIDCYYKLSLLFSLLKVLHTIYIKAESSLAIFRLSNRASSSGVVI